MDSAIQTADERMVYVTGDKEAIRAYEMRMMALSDLTSYQNYAREIGHKEGFNEGREKGLEMGRKEGLEEGREEGREEEKRRFMELLNQGLSIEEIKRRFQQP